MVGVSCGWPKNKEEKDEKEEKEEKEEKDKKDEKEEKQLLSVIWFHLHIAVFLMTASLH